MTDGVFSFIFILEYVQYCRTESNNDLYLKKKKSIIFVSNVCVLNFLNNYESRIILLNQINSTAWILQPHLRLNKCQPVRRMCRQ